MFGQKTGGRQQGTPNRTSAMMREAIAEAFERAGGVDYLVRVAQEHPDVFCRLLAKLMPTQLKFESQGPTLEELLAPIHERRVQRLAALEAAKGTAASGVGSSDARN